MGWHFPIDRVGNILNIGCMTNDDFLAAVEAFLTETGMKPSPFGEKALRDPSFVRNLRDGRSCSLETVGRVTAFMADYRTQSVGAAE